SWQYLGETFDVHGGGIDLIFPHHENEIAQSRCAFHTPVMANYWMHNGFLQVEDQKMAKSLGNLITIHELVQQWPGEVLRMNMLRTHYRQPMDWTAKGLQESEKILSDWYQLIGDTTVSTDTEPDTGVMESLCDDLNTPNVLTRLHALAGEIRAGEPGPAQISLKTKLKSSAMVLGLLEKSQADYLRSYPQRSVLDEAKIERLIAARTEARKGKNFGEADSIRGELTRMGVEIEDHKDGTTSWKIKVAS